MSVAGCTEKGVGSIPPHGCIQNTTVSIPSDQNSRYWPQRLHIAPSSVSQLVPSIGVDGVEPFSAIFVLWPGSTLDKDMTMLIGRADNVGLPGCVPFFVSHHNSTASGLHFLKGFVAQDAQEKSTTHY